MSSESSSDNYMGIAHIITHLALARRVGEMGKASFSKSELFRLVFLFKVIMVEIVNEQALQMLVSSSVGAAFSIQP